MITRLALFGTAIIVLLIIIACGTTTPQLAHVQPTKPTKLTTIAKQIGPPAFIGPQQPPTPTPLLDAQALHGPTNFALSNPLNFVHVTGSTTDSSGTITQIDARTIQSVITNELKRFLFVVNSNNVVKVYTPGATSPIATQVTQLANGSTGIQYTQVTNSVTTVFDSTLAHDLMTVGYDQKYVGKASANDPIAATGSEVTVTFTTHVQWITADQIPTAPEHGAYQINTNGEVKLSWSPGKQANKYAIYRLIPNQDQQFTLLNTVTTTTYSDGSAEALKNAHATTGITYAIFSIGPTGVENPSDTVILVTTH